MNKYINRMFSAEMKTLVKLAIPIIGSSILHMAYHLTDMIWVGRIGVSAVASIGTAGFFINLGWALASVVVVGVSVKVAHSIGAKNKKAAGKYATAGAWGIAILALFYTSLLFSFRNQLIGFFNLQNTEVIDGATSYLTITAAGAILTFAIIFFIGIFNAHGFTKLSFRASLTGTVINIILDPIFIFGLKLGIQGAAYASIIAHAFALSIFLFLVIKSKKIQFVEFKPKLSRLWLILRIGSPASFQRISFIVIYIFLARIIAEWGSEAIAVQKIGVQIESITYMIVAGVLQAVSISIGQHFGAKNYSAIMVVYKKGLLLVVSISIVTTLLFLLIPDVLFSIFVSDPSAINLGRNYLMIIGISQVFMGVEMLSSGAFHGLGKTQFPAVVGVSLTSLRIPIAYLLGFYTALELNGVWWSIAGTSILKGILLSFLFYRVMRKLIKKKNIFNFA
ncbi:MAG: MATE family efflux transporter [Bacteroidetes bacterium]|nr:MATE family efflux transporter [Bacteroidota bacterium]